MLRVKVMQVNFKISHSKVKRTKYYSFTILKIVNQQIQYLHKYMCKYEKYTFKCMNILKIYQTLSFPYRFRNLLKN